MNWYVADSYKDAEWLDNEPFEDEKGRHYITARVKCPRCGGTGNYSYNQIDGTMCLKCRGNKTIKKVIRVYTPKEYESLQKQKQHKEMMRRSRLEDRLSQAAAYKHEAALKHNFNDDEKIYVVYGGNTYNIKETLKSLGAKFNPVYKWYFTDPPADLSELPAGYYLCEFSFDELYEYDAPSCGVCPRPHAESIVSDKLDQKMRETGLKAETAYYPAEIKTRIRNITATISSIRIFTNVYGHPQSALSLVSGQYLFVWITTSQLPPLVEGDVVNLTGTIKKFEEYKHDHVTYLNRCIIKRISEEK